MAELVGVTGDHRSPAPQERDGGQRLVDRRCLVEDHQVEQAGHRRKQVVDVGEGADPQRQRPGELVVVEPGQLLTTGGAAAAQGGGQGGHGGQCRPVQPVGGPALGGEPLAERRRASSSAASSSLPVGVDVQAAAGDEVGGDPGGTGHARCSGWAIEADVRAGAGFGLELAARLRRPRPGPPAVAGCRPRPRAVPRPERGRCRVEQAGRDDPGVVDLVLGRGQHLLRPQAVGEPGVHPVPDVARLLQTSRAATRRASLTGSS